MATLNLRKFAKKAATAHGMHTKTGKINVGDAHGPRYRVFTNATLFL